MLLRDHIITSLVRIMILDKADPQAAARLKARLSSLAN